MIPLLFNTINAPKYSRGALVFFVKHRPLFVSSHPYEPLFHLNNQLQTLPCNPQALLNYILGQRQTLASFSLPTGRPCGLLPISFSSSSGPITLSLLASRRSRILSYVIQHPSHECREGRAIAGPQEGKRMILDQRGPVCGGSIEGVKEGVLNPAK